MDRLTYSPIVNGILESEGKIAGWPRTPAMVMAMAMGPTFHKNQKHLSQVFVPSEIIDNKT